MAAGNQGTFEPSKSKIQKKYQTYFYNNEKQNKYESIKSQEDNK